MSDAPEELRPSARESYRISSAAFATPMEVRPNSRMATLKVEVAEIKVEADDTAETMLAKDSFMNDDMTMKTTKVRTSKWELR